ncbi:hypothetical protein C0J52_21113 [Blattella germanica]|nr:hypothetical protein C0J52_21113 [Blattella germanica]
MFLSVGKSKRFIARLTALVANQELFLHQRRIYFIVEFRLTVLRSGKRTRNQSSRLSLSLRIILMTSHHVIGYAILLEEGRRVVGFWRG